MIGDRLHVYGPDHRHVRTHQVNPVRGSFNRLDEHRRQEATDWTGVAERLRARWNCAEFQHLINGFRKENPRHLAQQLRQVELLLDAENPPRALVTEVINHCCREFRYRFTQFKAVYEPHAAMWATGGGADAEPPAMDEVRARDMERYREAYRRRCEPWATGRPSARWPPRWRRSASSTRRASSPTSSSPPTPTG